MSWHTQLVTGLAVKDKSPVNCAVPKPSGTMTRYGKYHIQNHLMVGTITESLGVTKEWTLTGVADSSGDALLLPWALNRICWGQLDGQQDRFLTARMNGCGLLVMGDRANPVIAHVNESGVNLAPTTDPLGPARQRCDIYRNFLHHLQETIPGCAGESATWFPGEDYSVGGAFGVKVSGIWKIYGHDKLGKNSTTKLIWPVDAVADGDNRNRCKCCYITTAICDSMGLADDCDELQTLRWFRDYVMNSSIQGQHDVANYYANAPKIVAAINADADAASLYLKLYHHTIRPAIVAIQQGDMRTAYAIYRQMVIELEPLIR